MRVEAWETYVAEEKRVNAVCDAMHIGKLDVISKMRLKDEDVEVVVETVRKMIGEGDEDGGKAVKTERKKVGRGKKK